MTIPTTNAADYISVMLGRIVERFRPLQVILFGSHARGEAGPWSDVERPGAFVNRDRPDVAQLEVGPQAEAESDTRQGGQQGAAQDGELDQPQVPLPALALAARPAPSVESRAASRRPRRRRYACRCSATSRFPSGV